MSETIADQQFERSHPNEDQIVLGLLDAVERNSSVTQRNVSRELGIALGLANAYLKRCVRKGLIKVSEVPSRRYAYFLTPQGFAEKSRLTADYLSHSFAFFRRARSQCSEIFDLATRAGRWRVVCVGQGDLAEIAALVAREKAGIEFLGVIDAVDVTAMRSEAAQIGQIDAVIVTALQDARGVLATAREVFGVGHVYVPALLKIHVETGSSKVTA